MNIDQARLRPHLRDTTPHLIVQPDNGTLQIATFAYASAGELRGIPVVGRGVSGVQPGTHPETETVRRATA